MKHINAYHFGNFLQTQTQALLNMQLHRGIYSRSMRIASQNIINFTKSEADIKVCNGRHSARPWPTKCMEDILKTVRYPDNDNFETTSIGMSNQY